MKSLMKRFSVLLLSALLAHTAGAMKLPGEGVEVQPLKSSIAEETFQTLLVMRGLERLGYDVKPIKEIEYAAGHIAIGNGVGSCRLASSRPVVAISAARAVPTTSVAPISRKSGSSGATFSP